ncbi:MAG: hypothetical protein A2V70_20165 [Planctomycetes bacterium RBG_13_63_9]|nr:MAG: hypothetical protein A2V70_20165 [Planctomycetes bacterium RBG_13_63_9]
MTTQKRRSSARPSGRTPSKPPRPPVRLRIIGGQFRGQKLRYSGDMRVRPMKDRLREAVFNLIGPAVTGKHAIDLFAGTGALGLEALSRGAARATLIEQHFPTAAIIRENVTTLGTQQLTEIVTADVFAWFRGRPQLGAAPWVVFSSPPYDFYVDRTDQMLDLIGGLMRLAPANSIFVVESDGRFDFRLLPDAEAWDVRSYPPAVVGIRRMAS